MLMYQAYGLSSNVDEPVALDELGSEIPVPEAGGGEEGIMFAFAKSAMALAAAAVAFMAQGILRYLRNEMWDRPSNVHSECPWLIP